MSMNENCLCVLVVTKTAKVSVSVSVSGVGLGLDYAGLGLGLGLPGLGLGLGLGLSGLGLVLVSDSLVLITSLIQTQLYTKSCRVKCSIDVKTFVLKLKNNVKRKNVKNIKTLNKKRQQLLISQYLNKHDYIEQMLSNL